MSAKKIILGITAGVAAAAITTIVLKKMGLWDEVCDRTADFKDKVLNNANHKENLHVKETLNTIPKGEEKNVTKTNFTSSKLGHA